MQSEHLKGDQPGQGGIPLHHLQVLHELSGFDVQSLLYADGRTATYRAIDLETEQPVELALVNTRLPSERDKASLRHAYNIARVVNEKYVRTPLRLIETGHGPVLVKAEKRAKSLAALVQEKTREGSGANRGEGFAYEISLALLTALASVHERGVVHKDLQPGNVFWQAEERRIILEGFGTSFQLASEHFDDTWDIDSQTSLTYVAPECTGKLNSPVDARADIYSCGIILYELFCGQPPFVFDDQRELLHAHVAYEPTPLRVMNPAVPGLLSRVVMKMLSKHPSERYQTAAGVLHDLKLVEQEQAPGHATVDLGSQDQTGIFTIPNRLYGRHAEVATLMEAFQTCLTGPARALFISGYSGVGKSSLVAEVQQPIVTQHGWYGAGKFEQFRRDVPYKGWVEALERLIQQLLAEPESVLSRVKQDLLETLQGNAGAINQLVPSAELIIGEQKTPPGDTPESGQKRFTNLVSSFVKAIARREHPVVLFLDDLQWADLPSLTLLEALISDRGTAEACVLILGAYRSNEVGAGHPLTHLLERVGPLGRHTLLDLQPLPQAEVAQLVGGTLLVDARRVEDVAAKIVEKTAGNPFFVKQYLQALYRQGVFEFDRQQGNWRWDVAGVGSLAATDNVIDLLMHMMGSWPALTRSTLSAAACIGSHFDLATLSKVVELDEVEVAGHLQPALQATLILPDSADYRWVRWADNPNKPGVNPSYRFQHDRVQQSAHDLADAKSLSRLQYRIAKTKARAVEEGVADDAVAVMDHLSECMSLISNEHDVLCFARMCLLAAQQAKASMAIEPGWQYARSGLRLLKQITPTTAGRERGNDIYHTLLLDLKVECADLGYISGRFEAAQEAGAWVLERSTNLQQRVLVHNALIGIGVAQRQHANAVDYGIRVLRNELGVSLPAKASLGRVLSYVFATRLRLGRRRPGELLHLPRLTDPNHQAAMSILMKCATNAYWGSPLMVPVIGSRMVELSMRLGNCGLSAYGYALYGMILSSAVKQPVLGYEFGELSMELLARTGERHLLARTGLLFHGFIRHTRDPLSLCASETLALFDQAMDAGDEENACYCVNVAYYTDLLAGCRLEEIQQRYQPYLDILLASNQEQTVYTTRCWMQVVHNLRQAQDPSRGQGKSTLRGDWADWEHDSQRVLNDPTKQMESALVSAGAGWLAFLQGDWHNACRHFTHMYERRLSAMGMAYLNPCLAMYAVVLVHQQSVKAISGHRYSRLIRRLRRGLAGWVSLNPGDYRCFEWLLKAEVAAAAKDPLAAGACWISAAEAARESGFSYVEAWAVQRAADAHDELGHVVQARELDNRAFVLWEKYGALACIAVRWGRSRVSTTAGIDVGHMSRFEFRTALDSIRAVSATVNLDTLVTRVLELAIKITAGKRATLLTGRAADNILAVAEINENGLLTTTNASGFQQLPMSLVDYIVRTQEVVIIDNAQRHDWLSRDAYVLDSQARSLLGLPLATANSMVGVVIVENNLGAGLFSNSQAAMVETVMAQAAIALENARLYEAQIRRAESFRRFVPGNFLEVLGRADISDVQMGEAVERHATVLFADIRGFTQYAEQAAPDASFNLLNRFFAAMNPIITSHGGFVDEFMGDGIKALFLGDVHRSITVCVEMQQALADLNGAVVDIRSGKGQPGLHIGVGLHWGPTLLGTVGAQARLSTKAIGDTVNVASRIESLTKQYQCPVLITDAVVGQLAGDQAAQFNLRMAGRVRPAGRAQAVDVYDVLDARPADQGEVLIGILPIFNRALEQYFARHFSQALAGFAQCLEAAPGDWLSRHYHSQSQHYLDNPPAADWQGIEDQQGK